jgi:hypothetical protein
MPGTQLPHGVNRGDRREKIFLDDQDRDRFLETLGEVCARTAVNSVQDWPAEVVNIETGGRA